MSGKVMKKLAKPMLFAAAFIWGSSFFIMKDTLDSMPVQCIEDHDLICGIFKISLHHGQFI